MSVIIILIGISLSVASFFLIAFVWSVKKGQYEDCFTPSIRMLADDTPARNNSNLIKDSQNK